MHVHGDWGLNEGLVDIPDALAGGDRYSVELTETRD